jgi:hypothetical protein
VFVDAILDGCFLRGLALLEVQLGHYVMGLLLLGLGPFGEYRTCTLTPLSCLVMC